MTDTVAEQHDGEPDLKTIRHHPTEMKQSCALKLCKVSDCLLKTMFCVFALFTDHFLIVSFSFSQEMKSSDSDTAPAALRKRKRGSSGDRK